MVTHGLSQEEASKVVVRANKKPYDKIIFSKYAKIGLSKFYQENA